MMKSPKLEHKALTAGLYLVPTPIGNLQDITLRALDVLVRADQIWAEDTRETRKLLAAYEIAGKILLACHDHNEAEMQERLEAEIAAGKVIAFVSDAGMPLISDPGFRLVQRAIEKQLYYTVLPGASAVPTALALSGLPSHAFGFFGFTPNKSVARQKFFENLSSFSGTAIFFESPRRLAASLADAAMIFGVERRAAVVREISKKFEEVKQGDLQELAQHYEAHDAKGEIVLLVDLQGAEDWSDASVAQALQHALKDMRLKDAVAQIVKESGRRRNDVYKMALALEDKN